MSIFEYVMVIVSIVLGLSVAQILRGLGQVLRSNSRHVATTAWLIALFVVHLQLWWNLWSLSGVDRWTQAGFLLVAMVPCSLFAATDALVPSGSEREVGTRDHFDRVAPWFYSLFLAFLLLSVLWTWLLLELSLDHSLRVLELIGIVSAIMGLAWRRKNVHTLAAVIYLGTLMLGQWVFRPFLYG